MAIPDYQTSCSPLLRRVGESTGPVAVRALAPSVADEFHLTEDERSQNIPSGQENLLTNRLQWARTYMVKAGLLAAPKRGLVEITDRGRAMLSDNLERVDNGVLGRFPEFTEWLQNTRGRAVTVQTTEGAPTGSLGLSGAAQGTVDDTPLERIGSAVLELEEATKTELLARVREMTPADFELLIVRLLLAMGYGQGSEEMAKALGGTGDGGIDGLIHQDPLGLDRVYIQAKRYREGNNVSSPDIRNPLAL